MILLAVDSAFQRLAQLAGSPTLVLAALMGAALFLVALISDRSRHFAIGAMLFVSMCAPATDYFDQWLRPVFPFDMLVLYGRPIVASMLVLATLTLALRINVSDQKKFSTSPMALAMIALQLALCFRLVTRGAVGEAFSRGAIFGMLFFSMGVLVCSSIRTPADLRLVCRYLATALGLYTAASLIMMAAGYHQGMVQGRWFGLTGNPNHNAIVVAIFLPAALGLMMSPNETKRHRIVWASIATGSALPLLLSGSRGGVFTAIIGLLLVFRRHIGKLIFVLAPLACIAYLAAAFVAEDPDVLNRYNIAGASNTRTAVWEGMLKDWLTNPIFGSAGAFGVAENAYLGTLQRLGLVGLALLMMLAIQIGRGIVAAHRNRANLGPDQIFTDVAIAGIGAIAANSMFEATFFSNLNQTVFAIYLYFSLLGAAGRVSWGGVPASPHPQAARSYS